MSITHRFPGTTHRSTEFVFPKSDLTVTISDPDHYRFQVGRHYVILGRQDVQGLASDLSAFIEHGASARFQSIYPQGWAGTTFLETSYLSGDFTPDQDATIRMRITDIHTRQQMAVASVDLTIPTSMRLADMLCRSLSQHELGDGGLGAA